MGPYAPDPQGVGGRGIDACLAPELLQPSWLYLVEQVALSGQGVDWPEGMSERWFGGEGAHPLADRCHAAAAAAGFTTGSCGSLFRRG